MDEFSTKIKESSHQLSARERIMYKDTSNAVKLDEACDGETPTLITPKGYVILDVHNPKSEQPDYNNFIIYDTAGTKYVTGSQSFWKSFISIWEEMAGEDEEYSIEVYKVPSKNYKGKFFLTCSIV